MKRAFETYATGQYTAAELRRRITDWGLTSHSGKPIVLSKIPVMLANPFYMGLFRYKGEIQGAWGSVRNLSLNDVFMTGAAR